MSGQPPEPHSLRADCPQEPSGRAFTASQPTALSPCGYVGSAAGWLVDNFGAERLSIAYTGV